MAIKNPSVWTLIPTIDPADVELSMLDLALVVPEASVNYMTNPSIEVNTTGYSSKIAPIRDLSNSFPLINAASGRYALKMTPLDTNYSQVMAVRLPAYLDDARIPTSTFATASFDIYGKPGEVVTASIETPTYVDFFNRTGTLAGSMDDRLYSPYTYAASAGLTLQNSRVEATTLTDRIRAYIVASTSSSVSGVNLTGTFEADIRGIFTSGAVGAWPVMLITYNPGAPEKWIGVRAEQGQIRLLSYDNTVETSIASGAFTFVTGTQYNIRIVLTSTGSNSYSVNVYVNNTLLITNAALTSTLVNYTGGSYTGFWLTVAGAPTGANPYWDNLIYRRPETVISKRITLAEDYQRITLSYYSDGSYAQRYMLFLQKTGTLTLNSFWTDAFQYELKSYATTYFDGDNGGTWDGLSGQSSSSRSALQDGGRIRDFTDLSVRVTALQGGGMPPLENISIPMSSSGGEFYQQTLSRKSVKNIVCVVNGDNGQDLARKMRDLESCFQPDALTGIGKPTKLYYRILDPITGTARGKLLQTGVRYRAGLEGSQSNEFQQKFVLQLETLQTPDISEVYPKNVTLKANGASGLNTSNDLVRVAGSWGYAGTGVGGGNYFRTVYIDRRGVFWYGATNGPVVQENVGGYTDYPTNLTLTGASTVALAFLQHPNGQMYIGGSFTSPGAYFIRSLGGGAAFALAGSAWNSDVNCLALLNDGTILVGGNFTAPTSYLALYSTVTNTASVIVAGLNGAVRDIVVLPDGSGFYFTGAFTTSTAVATLNRIGFYNLNTSTLSALTTTAGNGINNTGRALALDAKGKLYVGGDFTTAGGLTIGFVAAWNGATFEPVGSATNGLNSSVYGLAYSASENMLYAVGQFLLTGKRALTPGFAKFNGSIWLPCDIAALPGAGISYTSIAVNANYQLIGMSTPGGNTLFSGTNAFVTYTGTAGTNPRIFLDNSTGTTAIRIYQLYNTTTGKTIYFDYNIAIGELLTIEITPSGVVINSNYGGSKPGAILPGSDTYSFGFQPGVNKLTFTTSDRSSSNFSAYILYKNIHWSFNGGVY